MGKKYRTERRRIDARRAHIVIHNQDAVEYYNKHPNETYGWLLGPATGDGPPSAEAAAGVPKTTASAHRMSSGVATGTFWVADA
jgi:hypothetical protein